MTIRREYVIAYVSYFGIFSLAMGTFFDVEWVKIVGGTIIAVFLLLFVIVVVWLVFVRTFGKW